MVAQVGRRPTLSSLLSCLLSAVGHYASVERIMRKQMTIPYSWGLYTLVAETVLILKSLQSSVWERVKSLLNNHGLG